MARTVVGLFRNHKEAQDIKHDLVNQGYSADDIRVVSTGQQSQSAVQPSSTAEPSESGFAATMSNFFRSLIGSDPEDEKHYAEGVKAGGALLAVTVPDDRADMIASLLERQGATNVEEQSTSSSGLGAAASKSSDSGQKLNVVEEELQVGKRQVQRGGIRVYSHVTERPVEEKITLQEEHVRVERRPANRAATEADFQAVKAGSIELHESAEEVVVSKAARVIEEVVVGKEVSQRQETVKDTLRRTDIEVEHLGATKSGEADGYGTYEPDFRKHFETNYGKAGKSYDLYAPAYQYGHKLANDPRYAKSDWATVEATARSSWAGKSSSTWEDIKDAVRHGWEKVHAGAKSSR